jgi:D-glycero-alpha-D-manno-heptose 1-phosphate guanylyltransferase
VSNITAAILAGGLGTRLRSVVSAQPKVLAPVNGRPFLAYLLDQLAAIHIDTAILCTGYKAEQISATFGQEYRGIRLLYSKEDQPMGTAGALRLSLPQIDHTTALVLNGDSYCAVSIADFVVWHQSRQSTASMVVREVPDTERYGRVTLTGSKRIASFDEKCRGLGPGWINAGIYLLSRELLHSIPPGRSVSLERDMLPAWLGQGIGGYPSRDQFLDIGLPETYAQASDFFARQHRNAA